MTAYANRNGQIQRNVINVFILHNFRKIIKSLNKKGSDFMNVAEVIPYKNYKEKFTIVFEELMKDRYVEVWDNFIYSAKKQEV